MSLVKYYPAYCTFVKTLGILPCEFNKTHNEIIHSRSGFKYYLYVFNFIFIIIMTAKQLLMLTLTYYFMDAEPKADKDLILKVQLLWFMGVLGAAMMVVFQAIYLKAWVRFLN